MRKVNIRKITERFRLSDHDAFSAILAYGNKTNQKVLCDEDDAVYIPLWLWNEIESVESRNKGYVYEEADVLKLRVPLDQATTPAVYFLYDGDEIVYIGQSKEVFGRIASHVRDGEKQFDSFAIIHVSAVELDAVEKANIEAYRPRYNSLCNFDKRQHLSYILNQCMEKI